MADEPRANLPEPADVDGGKAAVVDYRAADVRAGRGPGFFTIYKRGQGYWTRMGTALGAGLIAVLFANFVYTQMTAWTHVNTKVCLAIAGVLLVTILFFAWRAMNKPRNADFLIATDSEMKKVNWTTRKELIGSTKVVIFFVILISLILFTLDVLFGYFFYLIKVLQFGPFQ